MTTFETFSAETRSPRRGRIVLALARAAIGFATARLAAWKNRREVARLLEWDDYMLRDIGLTQGDVYCAMAAQVDEDPSVQLTMLAMERRHAHRAQTRDRLSRAAELRVRRS
ncbi:MAG: DUF1127 domain-containing protein [Rhizobiales bacterium]|nr:DUF1127 domain-containing protein [Hyphomicrobiales bacterium]